MFNHYSGLIQKIFELCIFVVFIFFWENNSFETWSDNSSSTIKARLIGTIHRSSLYTESFSCSPHYRVHLSMDFIFVWPIMMFWSIFSSEMITAIYISTWSSIVSSWNNSTILDNHRTRSSWNTFWGFRNFIGNTQEIFISQHEKIIIHYIYIVKIFIHQSNFNKFFTAKMVFYCIQSESIYTENSISQTQLCLSSLTDSMALEKEPKQSL